MTYKNRIELKYILQWKDYEKIKQELKPYLLGDKNTAKNNRYLVSSLYYDSPNRAMFYEKIDGFDFRYKLRVRTYIKNNIPDKTFVEIKRRNDKNILKSRVDMTLDEAKKFIEEPILFDISRYSEHDQKALKEIAYLKHLYNLVPIIQISYYREPYIVKYSSNLRLTFDTGIRFINEQKPSLGIKRGYVIGPQYVIMEIKHRGLSGLIPRFIAEIIEKHNLLMTTYSKYCEGVIRVRGIPP